MITLENLPIGTAIFASLFKKDQAEHKKSSAESQ
jgi:hypothetical protein